MSIRRIAIGAVIVAATAVPLTAGAAAALPPNGQNIQAWGSGSTPDAAKADATTQLGVAASYAFAYFCYPAYYWDAIPGQSGGWLVHAQELCLTN